MRIVRKKKLFMSSTRRMMPLLALMSLMASGCATGGKYMSEATPIFAPEHEEALVTFIRPSSFGGAISFGIWDGDTLVGILGPKLSIQYQTAPGEHYFLARAENWSCVKADLASGKHYVIRANPVIGAWKARVALDPVTRSDYEAGQLAKVKGWLTEARPMMPDPGYADDYARPRRQQVLEAQAKFESGEGRYETLSQEDFLPE
jgi:hypothetical protein